MNDQEKADFLVRFADWLRAHDEVLGVDPYTDEATVYGFLEFNR